MLTIARVELGDAVLSHLRDFVYLADSVAEPDRRRDGREVYPGLLPKAAALLLAMLRLRPFASANARISLLATTVFLNRNGFDLGVDDDRLTALVAVASTGELTALQTAASLERFVQPLPQPQA